MLKISKVLGILASFVVLAGAEFIPSSRFFLNPDTGVALVKASADFWRTQKDDVNGGYFHYALQSNGTRSTESSANYKYFSPQSRLGYVFARAFMVTGDTTYLDDADYALNFLYGYGWDPSPDSGGWYYRSSLDGSKASGRGAYTPSSRWSYMQHYALLGPTTMLEAQGGQRFARNRNSPDHWSWIQKGLAFNEKVLWDDRPGWEGYYNQYDPETQTSSGKGFTPTVDAITTHIDNLLLMTDSAFFRTRLQHLGDAMADYLVGAIDSTDFWVRSTYNPKTHDYRIDTVRVPKVYWGIPEEFTTNWAVQSTGYAMVGHTIKTAWCLGRTYLSIPDARYLRAAERVFDSAWVEGLIDTVRGGPYYDISNTNPKASPSTDKNYWTLEQGYNAGVMLARLTSDPLRRERALRMAQGSVDFFYQYLAKPNGSALLSTDEDGTTTFDYVGDEWDAGYHASEFAWLVYLYGNLLNERKTVTLYYKLAPSLQKQTVRLTPLRLPGDSLAIHAVRKNGSAFTAYDANQRQLTLAAGEGGVFKVTFGYRNALTDGKSSVLAGAQPGLPSLSWHQQNLMLHVQQPGHLRIRLLHPRGQVETWAARDFSAGSHSLSAPHPLPSGVYWIMVDGSAGSQRISVVVH